MPFVERTVNSELSGNMIDLCPVGALTSKPFRYTARAWELTRRASVSPHDSLGANLAVHVKNNRVMRVVPRENEAINECWLSDKDRYSYEALNSEQRLTQPMIKRHGEWQECDWQTALEYVANGLKRIRDDHGAAQIGALATPHSTLEELYLLQKFVRGLGSGNVDHRTRQSDFAADSAGRGAPWLGQSVSAVQELDRVLVIGSTLRKDHPLLAHRLRLAVKAGAELNLLNPVDDDLLCKVANKLIVSPAGMQNALAQVLKALAEIKQSAVPQNVAAVSVSPSAQAIAASLAAGDKKAVLLGNLAQHHPRYSEVHALAQEIARVAGATLGVMGEAANSVGAYLAGAVPFAGPLGKPATVGMNAAEMVQSPRLAYLLLNTEIELDCHDPQMASGAMENAELVVAMSAYRHQAMNYADVILPVAPFAETSGTFVNTEGRVQSFNAVVKPLGETRPAWKVLRVLGNMFNLHGFDYNSSEDVRADILSSDEETVRAACSNQLQSMGEITLDAVGSGVQRIAEVPIYQADALVRRADSLQRTVDGAAPEVSMNGALMAQLQLENGGMAMVRQGAASTVMRARRDDKLPPGCARVPAAHPLTAGLGAMFGEIVVEKA
jgi:NADH-quinone oxidoreductase subunit G